MSTIMQGRHEILDIEYFQIVLNLWNNKPSCIFYLISFQNKKHSSFLIISDFPMVPYFSNRRL